jgi:hypothetical protein
MAVQPVDGAPSTARSRSADSPHCPVGCADRVAGDAEYEPPSSKAPHHRPHRLEAGERRKALKRVADLAQAGRIREPCLPDRLRGGHPPAPPHTAMGSPRRAARRVPSFSMSLKLPLARILARHRPQGWRAAVPAEASRKTGPERIGALGERPALRRHSRFSQPQQAWPSASLALAASGVFRWNTGGILLSAAVSGLETAGLPPARCG